MLDFLKPRTWNDVLALTFGLIILAFWGLTGQKILVLPDIVLGATISTFTLIVQYYFRKARDEKPNAS